MDLRLSEAALGRYVVITVGGELDAATAPALAGYLAAVLGQQPGRDVILDVNGISFADAAGLTALLAADRTVRRGGGSLRLAGPPRQLRKLLALTGLTGRLASYPSTYAASTWPPSRHPRRIQYLLPALDLHLRRPGERTTGRFRSCRARSWRDYAA